MPDYDEALVMRVLAGERDLLPTIGWKCVPYRAEIDEVIRRGRAFGWTDREIARRTGLSAQTAYRRRKHLGLPPVPHPQTSRRYLESA